MVDILLMFSSEDQERGGPTAMGELGHKSSASPLSPWPTTWRGYLGAGVYIGGVTGGAMVAFSDPNAQGFQWPIVVLLAVTFPAAIGGLPVIYLLGGLAGHFFDFDGNGASLPVTLTYGLIFAGIAVANLLLLRSAGRGIQLRRRQRWPS